MKKILILAYDFPPYSSVGSERPYSWYKHFNKFNVYPIIVTRNWNITYNNNLDYIAPSSNKENITETNEFGSIIKSPFSPDLSNRILLKYGNNKFSYIRKLFSGITYFFQHIFLFGPKLNIYKAAKQFLEKNKVDAILVTGDPFILFKYGHMLSSEFNIPWFADYRDDWIKNHSRFFEKNIFQKMIFSFDKIHEKKYLNNCSGISSVSDFIVNEISQRIKCSNYTTIENGAELDNYVIKYNPYKSEDFIILYSGILYNLNYLDDFFLGFEKLLEKNNFNENIKVYFIGIETYHNIATELVHKMAEKYPLNVILEKRKDTTTIAQYQLHANVLLNLIAGDPEKGLIGAKSYNYAVTRNPILTIPQVKNKKSSFFPDRDIQFIACTNNEVYEFLSKQFSLFKNGVKTKTNLSDKERYLLSREYQSEKLINFIFKK